MSLSTQDVWAAMEDSIFGVLAFVNRNGEPRSAGVCYVVDGRTILISSAVDSWKVRHIEFNPKVSMTITVPKHIPFLPFIKIPAATVTFQGEAEILPITDVEAPVVARLLRGVELDRDTLRDTCLIRVTPRGDFVTYGIAMPLMQMRKVEQARGRAPTGTSREKVVA